MVKNITKEIFKNKLFDFESDEKYQGDKSIILDFAAESWCAPCKVLAPVLEEISDEHPEIDFYKINVDEEPELSLAFGIRSVPTLMFLQKNGDSFKTLGAIPKSELEDIISTRLKG